MEIISLLDTSVCDDNLGNEIIMQAVNKNLREIFPKSFFIKIPYLDKLGKNSIEYIRNSRYTFFGGTNSLSSEMNKYKQIGIDNTNAEFIENITLVGVGWWQYQEVANSYTRNILTKVLSEDCIHAVRDSYTKKKLEEIGFSNVLNTGCPTLWDLNEQHCQKIKKSKSDNVITTLTCYNKDIKIDKELLQILLDEYKKVSIWIQGPGDFDYIKELGFIDRVSIIQPSLDSYEKFLNETECDYIGNRLHAGIKAIQMNKRALIIGIDNRAIEMQKDFGLNVLLRQDIYKLRESINGILETKIVLPVDDINIWKKQFKNKRYLAKKKWNLQKKILFKLWCFFYS